MKKQLNYFSVAGAFGGSQGWLTNIVMNIGGCAALAACDSCIYLGREFDRKELYPFDLQDLNKKDYIKFSQVMKPYIRPRVRGVHKLSWYIDGFRAYLEDRGIQLEMEGFDGNRRYEEARSMMKNQLDQGYPVPYLLLRHQQKEKFKDFIWHWFMVVGYEETADDFLVTIATYGSATVFSLKAMWDTGSEEKGGFICYKKIS